VAPILGKDVSSVTLALSAMVGRQLPVFSVLIPGYLVIVLAGWRRMTEVFPAVLVAGVSFAVVQFLISNFVGPELTDVVAALFSMAMLAALLRVWRPRDVYRFEGEAATGGGPAPELRPRPLGGGATPPDEGVLS